MHLEINGSPKVLQHADVSTLAEVLAALELRSDRIAVELNSQIVPRQRWAETRVQSGDRLEIVHFVGGGRPGQQSAARRSVGPGSMCG